MRVIYPLPIESHLSRGTPFEERNHPRPAPDAGSGDNCICAAGCCGAKSRGAVGLRRRAGHAVRRRRLERPVARHGGRRGGAGIGRMVRHEPWLAAVASCAAGAGCRRVVPAASPGAGQRRRPFQRRAGLCPVTDGPHPSAAGLRGDCGPVGGAPRLYRAGRAAGQSGGVRACGQHRTGGGRRGAGRCQRQRRRRVVAGAAVSGRGAAVSGQPEKLPPLPRRVLVDGGAGGTAGGADRGRHGHHGAGRVVEYGLRRRDCPQGGSCPAL